MFVFIKHRLLTSKALDLPVLEVQESVLVLDRVIEFTQEHILLDNLRLTGAEKERAFRGHFKCAAQLVGKIAELEIASRNELYRTSIGKLGLRVPVEYDWDLVGALL